MYNNDNNGLHLSNDTGSNVRNSAQYFICISLLNPHNKTMSWIYNPLLYTQQLRFIEISHLAQSYKECKWKNWDLNLGLSNSKALFLTLMICFLMWPISKYLLLLKFIFPHQAKLSLLLPLLFTIVLYFKPGQLGK